MRTTGSDELYRLIHSLTTEEKGYFKKFAKRHSSKGNNYLLLFDAINKQKEFEEASLKKKFKNYKVWKNYLFNMILQTLVLSETEATPSETILQNMLRSRQLTKRGLTAKAQQIISASIELADRTDVYGLQTVLLGTQFNMQYSTWPREQLLLMVHAAEQQIAEVEKRQHTFLRLLFQQHLGLAMAVMKEYGQLSTTIEKELDLDLLNTNQTHLSEYLETQRQMVWMSIHYMNKDYEALHETQKKIYEAERKRYLQNKDVADVRAFIIVVTNYAVSCITMKKTAEALKLADALISLPIQNKEVRTTIALYYLMLMQLVLWFNGNHTRGEQLTAETIKQYGLMDMFPDSWWHISYVLTNKIAFEFSNKNYRAALQTFQFFQSAKFAKYSTHNKADCEIMYILIQFEIGNTELLPSLIDSVQNRLPDLSNPQKQFLKLMKKYAHTPSELFRQATALKEEVFHEHLFKISHWAESKISKKNLAEVVRHKATGT